MRGVCPLLPGDTGGVEGRLYRGLTGWLAEGGGGGTGQLAAPCHGCRGRRHALRGEHVGGGHGGGGVEGRGLQGREGRHVRRRQGAEARGGQAQARVRTPDGPALQQTRGGHVVGGGGGRVADGGAGGAAVTSSTAPRTTSGGGRACRKHTLWPLLHFHPHPTVVIQHGG
jgi:hypothetical protein